MAGVTAITIGEVESISGVLEGITFHKAAGALGVTSFGVSVIDLEPGADAYPEHDHSEQGVGGQMFAKRPQQLGQEEVYFALRGLGDGRGGRGELPARRRSCGAGGSGRGPQGLAGPAGVEAAGDRRHPRRGIRDGRHPLSLAA